MKFNFVMKDVRCFDGEQRIAMRPLTLLMGENSTGKSTVLGSYQALSRVIANGKVNFNIPPYQMGAFSNIVRSVRGQKIQEFVLGLDFPSVECYYVFTEGGSEPVLSGINIWVPGKKGKVDIKFTKMQTPENRREESPTKVRKIRDNEFEIEADIGRFMTWRLDIGYILYYGAMLRIPRIKKEVPKDVKEFRVFLKKCEKDLEVLRSWRFRNVGSISPIRSDPLRTYNPLSEEETPQGTDVPMYLMRLARTDKQKWEALRKELAQFGKDAGMFDDIYIKKLGDSIGYPFQIQFKIRKMRTNIMDVGYGVSQILPILVRFLAEKKGSDIHFLLQQPEVHLHPSGQAALASLLVYMASKKEKAFLVETHSDYIIDRVRIEIRNGRIPPEDVSLVYHEPTKNGVKIHNISFDKQGNMLNVPIGFQRFIARETNALLGLE